MMINKTSEYFNCRQSLQAGHERAPRFLRRETTVDRGADIVDISDAARKRMQEKNSSPLVKAIMSFSREIGELVRTTEGEDDARRSARVEELRTMVRNGSYNFEKAGRLESAALSLTGRMKTGHNDPECA